jgi:hypothetical protein
MFQPRAAAVRFGQISAQIEGSGKQARSSGILRSCPRGRSIVVASTTRASFGCLRGGAENWVDEGSSPG